MFTFAYQDSLSLIMIHINAAILESLWLNCGIYIKNNEIHFIEMGLKNVTKKNKKLSTHFNLRKLFLVYL